MAQDLVKWRQDHQSIDMLSSRLSGLLSSGASAAELARVLQHLVELVAEHIATEDAILYDMTLAGQPGINSRHVEATRGQFEQLKCDWQTYLTLWSKQAIERDRARFEAETRTMLNRLRRRVAFEDELLVTLALDRCAPKGRSHSA